ncbi:MAG: hypothetical protein R6U98_15520, partial [Pirellulaceae bacterium]
AFPGANATGLSRGPLRSTLPTGRRGVSGRFVAASVNHHGTSPWHPCGPCVSRSCSGTRERLHFFRMERCPTQAVLPPVGFAAENVIRDRYNP